MMKLFNLRSILTMLLGLSLLFADLPMAYAQSSGDRTISGVVKDSDGFPVIGAGVVQKGTQNGVVTNEKGEYSITLPSSAAALEFSCIGYKTQIVSIGKGRVLNLVMDVEAYQMEEVSVVAYGFQKKETVTGAISAIGTEQLLSSPNTSLANSLAGQISGVSTVQSSGQPGSDEAQIFVRGTGSLSDGNSKPLILVDGVEMDFFQMDANEIENISVLKDASATAVFGVRGANGVILVTTKRGMEGRPKIQWSSSVGLTRPTRLVEIANSYDTGMMYNEMERNDGVPENELSFSPYVLEAFRTHSNPIMFPDMDWYDYLLKDVAVQTQHNVNVSGGTKRVKYFASVGFLYQDGMVKELGNFDYKTSHSYTRYNYRANLDIDVTNTTNLRLSIGGIVGNQRQPNESPGGTNGSWHTLALAQPFSSPGLIDGHYVRHVETCEYFGKMKPVSGIDNFYGNGYHQKIHNTMNLNLELTQKLDFITKGLSLSIKGAYNTSYSLSKKRNASVETWVPYFVSSRDGSGLVPGDPGFNTNIVYDIKGQNLDLEYSEDSAKDRDWYLEAALRYKRNFNGHNVGALLLYNQSKRYYPSVFPGQPSGYVGLVGRVTYNYKTRYLAEFNCGYNGSENFAPKQRYGFFPAVSAGWILTEEPWMKNQKVFNYLKIRATVGLVGSDNVAGGRYLYIPEPYALNENGYFFGKDVTSAEKQAFEGKLANDNVTWEKALKQNYAVEATFLRSRLKFTFDYFREFRKDILTRRNTLPGIFNMDEVLPNLNLGKVRNHGFEVELKWADKVGDFSYFINANTSFARNKILYMDEITPSEEYQRKTGRSRGLILGYVTDGFYKESDFKEGGGLVDGLPDPYFDVKPGDVKYVDLNNDNKIDDDDRKFIGFPTRPEFTFGLNYGISYKGLHISMNWTGATNRSMILDKEFRMPFGPTTNRSLCKYFIPTRWTPETADTATMPRLSDLSEEFNHRESDLWVRNASYLRLKSVKIGYTITKGKVLRALGISSFNVHLSGFNLLTIDGIKILDPESKAGANIQYPITKTYNLGIVVNF